jgi:flagellar biosynthetic protein FlhB
MAEDQGFDKTELPTQRRRDDARAQGQFAYSHELINGLLLYAGAMILSWGGVALSQGLGADLHSHISRLPTDITVDSVQSQLTAMMESGVQLVGGLVAGLFVVGLGANLGQAGLHINTESLGPKWERLNPAENWHKIVSLEGAMRGGFSIAKVVMLGFVSWWVLSDRGAVVLTLAEGVLGQSVSTAWGLAIELITTSSAVLLVLGAADYGFQWFRNEQKMMMTREEMKQEKKDDDGDPHVQARRRQRAREIAGQRRMIDEVPKATVVITNPTHIAIALRYQRGVDSAPVVIAKGRDQFALMIAAKARRHGIPVVERKPIARALFKTVKVGQEIPQALFVAVSEVLAYIYRLRGTNA